MEDNELQEIINAADLRYATMGDIGRVTHAICTEHGMVVPIETDSHDCTWRRLVPKEPDSP